MKLEGRNVLVPPWGLHLRFSPAFGSVPIVTVTAKQTGRSASVVGLTKGHAIIFVYNADQHGLSGRVDYTIRG